MKGQVYKKQGSGDLLNLTPGKGVLMLILTRRIGEKLVIGDNVISIMMGAKGSQIRIGIEAPRDVQVHREEIYKRILKERVGLNSARCRETP